MKKFEPAEAIAILDAVVSLLGRPIFTQPATCNVPETWKKEKLLYCKKMYAGAGSIEVGFTQYPHRLSFFVHAILAKKAAPLAEQRRLILALVKQYPGIEVSYNELWERDWNRSVEYDEHTHRIRKVCVNRGVVWLVDQTLDEIMGTTKPRYKKFEKQSDFDVFYANL